MPSILHVGAHHGGELQGYLQQFDSVTYVEADPDNYKELVRRASGTHARTINVAVSDRKGTATLRRTSYSESHSLFELAAAHLKQFPTVLPTDLVEVQTDTLDNLFGNNPSQFTHMVLDIQGAELLALKGGTKLLPFIKNIVCEVSFEETYKGCPLMGEIDEFLKGFGFSRIALSKNGCYGDATYARAVVREENIIGKWEAVHAHWAGVLSIEQNGEIDRPGVQKSSGTWALDGDVLEIRWRDWPTERLYRFDGEEFKGRENFKSLKRSERALFINRNDRKDRLDHMVKEMKSTRFNMERIEATVGHDAHGFSTPEARYNWLSHMEAIKRIASDKMPTIIFEDDIRINDVRRLYEYLDNIKKNEDWDVIYFYGSRSNNAERITGVLEAHAYMVNPKSAQFLHDELEKAKEDIESGKIWSDDTTLPPIHRPPLQCATYIDQYYAHVLQPKMKFFGTPTLVVQDRSFGSDTGWMGPKNDAVTVLLTATISPKKNVPHVALRDEKERLVHYLHSLLLWSRSMKTDKIVFCENSATKFDFSSIKNFLEKSGKEFEVLVFDGNKETQEFGKGRGEQEILEYALDNSILLRKRPAFFKVTGRLFIENFDKVADNLHLKQAVFIPNSIGFDTRCFKVSRKLFMDFLYGAGPEINDLSGPGHYLEAVYRRRMEGKTTDFPEKLLFTGTSGTTGGNYDNALYPKVLAIARDIAEGKTITELSFSIPTPFLQAN